MSAPTALPVQKKEIFGWAMYDFANSSYTTVVITVLYGAFFVKHIVPPDSALRDTYWSIAIVAATVVAMLLSPLVGVLCDSSGQKKRYLAAASIVCALGTMGLSLVGPGDVWLGIAMLVVSNAGFMLGESFCASFLPELSTPKTMGIISGLGWGLGYFGGLLSLILMQLVVTADPAEDLAAYLFQNRLAMVLIGLFYLLAALPTFLLVQKRDRPAPGFESASWGQLLRQGFQELSQSFQLARKHKILFQFLGVFMVYMAGLEVVIKFIGIYAKEELSLTEGDLIYIFLIIQISAALGAFGFGFLESKLGAKPTVLVTIGWWILAVLAIFFLPDLAGLFATSQRNIFFVIAVLAGGGIGSIQSSSRAVVGMLSPPDRTAQMFGFWGMFNRAAIILGMLFGPLSDLLDSRRQAILLVVGFFVVGGLLLTRVPIQKGIDEAHGGS